MGNVRLNVSQSMGYENVDVKTISSREVATMMEMTHDNLLKKISKHIENFNKIEDVKINVFNYFIETTYKQTGNGKECKEYQVTKRGCEFLAHKTTGVKGDLFTVRYMERFEQMEQALKKQLDHEPLNEKREQLTVHPTVFHLFHYPATLKQMLSELETSTTYYDTLVPKKLYSVEEIANDYDIEVEIFNELLRSLGVQYERLGGWLLSPKHHGQGYTATCSRIVISVDGEPSIMPYMYWTTKGRLFLYEELKKIRLLPTVERHY